MNRNFMKRTALVLAIVIVTILLWLSAKSPFIDNHVKNHITSSSVHQYDSKQSSREAQEPVQHEEKPTEMPIGNHELLENKLELERHGALASVKLQVTDEKGNSIPQADVYLYFTQPKKNDPEGRVKGKTNSQGVFTATKKTNYECIWEVSKDGYHASSGSIKFSAYFSELSTATGQWTEKPIEIVVILKKMSNAQLIHGDRIWHELVIPTNTWVGFDFIECDSVAPYGHGQIAHIEFRLKSCRQLPSVKGGTHGYTNSLEILTSSGGMAIFKEDIYSHSPFMSLAPTQFPDETLIFTFARTRDSILMDTTLGKGHYIAFQAHAPDVCGMEKGNYYGILRRLNFSSNWIGFEYFFNSTPEDRQIDGDINSKCLHGR